MSRRHPQLANLDEIDARPLELSPRFTSSTKPLGRATSARGLGCTWYELASGKSAFPHHWHAANDEAIFVLQGTGTLRIGTEQLPIREGDYASFPTGPEFAHQLTNTGTQPLRYLCFSTLSAVDVAGYPDSKKLGVLAAPSAEAGRNGQHWIRHIAHEAAGVGYLDGEDRG
ncbi:MAG: cupin domain-containing protein [Deltaproteobacteria bacterium]|nr:cupin domain-containing protein [Deltaproteobacteria bacterium]